MDLPDISLYVHIPFCRHICPFCDFTKRKAGPRLYAPYVSACIHELQCYPAKQHRLKALFFGGGTPSVLPIVQLRRLFEAIHLQYDCSQLQEVSLEANPEDITPALLRDWIQLGITRLSVGVQTFQASECHFLGRNHSVLQSERALEQIKKTTLHLNIDLMFSLPHQTKTSLSYSLKRALTYSPDHMSCYGLTIEPHTSFFKHGVVAASPDNDFSLYTCLIDTLTSAGYTHYEVSSFCKPGYECIHNSRYWDVLDYIGIGVGAHSCMTQQRYANTRSFANYLADSTPACLQKKKPYTSEKACLLENIIANFRIPKGIDFRYYSNRYNIDFPAEYATAIQTLHHQGLIKKTSTGIAATKKGLYLLDTICLSFM